MTADRNRSALMYVAAAVLLAFIVLPLLMVVPISLNSGNSLSIPSQGWSLRWYAELWVDERWSNALWNSLVIGIATTFLSCLIGIPAAIGLAWGRFPGKRMIYLLVGSPLTVPVVIVGVAAFSFFASFGLVGTRLSIILMHTAMAAPVVVATVVASLATFDLTLVHAAQSLGAGRARTFFKVVLPLIFPGVATGAIIAFVISFDETVIASYLMPGAERTLPRMIFSGTRESISPAIAAVAVLLIVFSIMLLALAAMIYARSRRPGAKTGSQE